MKKIGKFIKSNTKLLVGIILGAAVSGGAVYAATVLPSSQVGYDNSTSGLAATDVQGALDELNQKTKNLYPMQGFNKSILSATGASAKVYDKRDGNIYTVKKLADGNVWMTENLRIAGKTITSADSNVTSDFTIPASSTSGFNAQDTNNAYVDSTYGGYYTFYTATAGTGGTSLATDGANAPSSICPKGWRLPTGGSTGEFNTLYGQYNSVALMMNVPNFTLSGHVRYGSVYDQGWGGYFWSSTTGSASYAYYLYLNSSNVFPALNDVKDYGFSVRCMAV
jgi:uncharacterized protein (TIGR02145 family)